MKEFRSNINSERASCSLHLLKSLSLSLLLLIPQFLFTQQINNTITFKIDNFQKTLKINTFNRKEYFSLSNLYRAQIKHSNSRQEPFTVQCGNYQFSFLPGSIYFTLKDLKQGNERILQISSPTIDLNGELWIPLKAFINCLTSIPLFEHSLALNSIVLNTNKEKLIKSSLEKKTVATTSQTNRTNRNRIKQSLEKNKTNKPISPLPRINLTLNERLSLEPQPPAPSNRSNFHKNSSEKMKEISKQKSRTTDTTANIPPKYYVLPPVLKNNPK